MEKYKNNAETPMTAEEIEALVEQYLRKTRSEASAEKTAEELRIIDMIIAQATF